MLIDKKNDYIFLDESLAYADDAATRLTELGFKNSITKLPCNGELTNEKKAFVLGISPQDFFQMAKADKHTIQQDHIYPLETALGFTLDNLRGGRRDLVAAIMACLYYEPAASGEIGESKNISSRTFSTNRLDAAKTPGAEFTLTHLSVTDAYYLPKNISPNSINIYSLTDETKPPSLLVLSVDRKFADRVEKHLLGGNSPAIGRGHFIEQITHGPKQSIIILRALPVDIDADISKDEREDISKFADWVLNNVLTGNRPVARWRTGFFVPVVLSETEEKYITTNGTLVLASKAAETYFHHGQRDLMTESLCSYDFTDEFDLTFDLTKPFVIDHGNYDGDLEFHLRAVRMHMLIGGIGMLEYEFGDGVSLDSENEDTYWDEKCAHIKDSVWRSYLSDTEDRPSLAQILDGLAELRYSGFDYERNASGKPTVIKWQKQRTDFSSTFENGIIGNILKNVTNNCKTTEDRILDSRSRAFTSLVLQGGRAEGALGNGNPLDGLMHRLMDVDPYGEDYSYDSDFTKKDLQNGLYGRFSGWGSYFLIADHAMAFAGFQGCLDADVFEHIEKNKTEERWSGKTRALRGLFSERFIHHEHMPDIYKRMFLLGLFQQCKMVLLDKDFHEKISVIESNNNEEDATEKKMQAVTKALYEHLQFRRKFWPEHITTEIQGRELFALMQKRLNIAQEWARNKSAINEEQAYLAAKVAETRAKYQQKLSQEQESRALHAAREAARGHVLHYIGMPLAVLFLLLHLAEDPFSPWFEKGFGHNMLESFRDLFGWIPGLLSVDLFAFLFFIIAVPLAYWSVRLVTFWLDRAECPQWSWGKTIKKFICGGRVPKTYHTGKTQKIMHGIVIVFSLAGFIVFVMSLLQNWH